MVIGIKYIDHDDGNFPGIATTKSSSITPCSVWNVTYTDIVDMQNTGDMVKFANVTDIEPCLDFGVNLTYKKRGKLGLNYIV